MIRINGQAVSEISAYDRGLHYGDGLFETIAVKNGKLTHWHYHWQRLLKGCERLNIDPPTESIVCNEIDDLVNHDAQAVIKLIITRGSGGRGYKYAAMQPTRILFKYPWPEYAVENQNGIELFLCETRLSIQPTLAGIKHLNRLENVLARNEWSDNRIVEGLMLATDERVVEGTMSNVFWAKEQRLFTPDITQVGVAGVMRQHILNLTKNYEMDVNIGDYFLSDIYQADELFVCNSLIGIWPVKKFENKTFTLAGSNISLTKKLQTLIV